MSNDYTSPVLLFDGECGLCYRIVIFLLKIDRRGVLRFSPLQGSAAQRFLRMNGLPEKDFSTLVFVADWEHYGHSQFLLRTDGVIASLRACDRNGLAFLLHCLPRGLRDIGYRLIAKTRYIFFGPWRGGSLKDSNFAKRLIE